jgi:hypothetical protein
MSKILLTLSKLNQILLTLCHSLCEDHFERHTKRDTKQQKMALRLKVRHANICHLNRLVQ